MLPRVGRAQFSELIENGCSDIELGHLALKRSGDHFLA